jgi:peptide/histidine transporter 3/4
MSVISNNSNSSHKDATIKRLFKKTLLYQSKGSVIILIVSSLLLLNLGFNELLQSPSAGAASSLYNIEALPVFFFYFIYPLLSLIGERFNRYRVICFSLVLLLVINAIVIVLNVVRLLFDQNVFNLTMEHNTTADVNEAESINSQVITSVTVLIYIAVFLNYVPYALFRSNIIQLGTDQMLFSPSQYIKTFIYWFIFIIPFTQLIADAIFYPLQYFRVGTRVLVFIIVFIAFLSFLTASNIILCFKKYINIEPTPPTNPLKVIYKVTMYALRHKVPSFRSAFTYGEKSPGRFDLAKQRYGGPFTTEQVEDVKSFGRILVVLISFSGWFYVESTVGITVYYTNITGMNLTVAEEVILGYPFVIQSFIFAAGILIFQLILFPYCSLRLPSILFRIGMGLFVGLLSSIVQTILSAYINEIPFSLLALPQMLNGVGQLLSFSIFEFIIAQAPYRMQGFLLGILYSQLSIAHISKAITILTPLGYSWIYYLAKTIIVFLFFIMFVTVALKYTPRSRNELSTVNERNIIEEHWDRILQEESETSLDESNFEIHSMSQ